MRKLFIVLALCGVSILNAQQLNVASYNVRNSNPNDAKAGNGWEQRCPVITQLITFHDFDIFGGLSSTGRINSSYSNPGIFGYRKIPRSRIKDGMQPIPASVHGENSRILQASSDSGSLTCTWTISE